MDGIYQILQRFPLGMDGFLVLMFSYKYVCGNKALGSRFWLVRSRTFTVFSSFCVFFILFGSMFSLLSGSFFASNFLSVPTHLLSRVTEKCPQRVMPPSQCFHSRDGVAQVVHSLVSTVHTLGNWGHIVQSSFNQIMDSASVWEAFRCLWQIALAKKTIVC